LVGLAHATSNGDRSVDTDEVINELAKKNRKINFVFSMSVSAVLANYIFGGYKTVCAFTTDFNFYRAAWIADAV